MSNFVYLNVYPIIYVKFMGRGQPNKVTDTIDALPKENTYIIVFTPIYKDQYEHFKKKENINILYETPMAANSNYSAKYGYKGYDGKGNRTQLIVFEMKD